MDANEEPEKIVKEAQRIINEQISDAESQIYKLINYSSNKHHKFISKLIAKKLLDLKQELQIFKDEQ